MLGPLSVALVLLLGLGYRSAFLFLLIATPDTFEDLYPILENIKRHIPLEIVGEVSLIDAVSYTHLTLPTILRV